MRRQNFLLVAFTSLTIFAIGCRSAPPSQSNSQIGTQANTTTVTESTPERPSLTVEIKNLSLYPVPNNRENLAISLVVTVRNSGSPSNVQDWKLTVTNTGRDDLENLDPVHVNGVVEMPGTDRKKVDLAKEDLAIMSKQSSIAKGLELTGILTFVLPKTSAEGLSNKSSGFKLHFKDSLGRSYQTATATIGQKR